MVFEIVKDIESNIEKIDKENNCEKLRQTLNTTSKFFK